MIPLRTFIGVLAVCIASAAISAPSATAAPVWQLPAADLSAPGEAATEPFVAVGQDGSATVVWSRPNGLGPVIQAATRPAGASGFGTPQTLTGATGLFQGQPRVAIGPDGTITAVWVRSDGLNTIIQSASRPAGQPSFGPPEDLSQPFQSASLPQVASASDASVTVVWTRSDGTTPVIQAATRLAGQTSFGPPENLSEAGQLATQPQLAIAPNGTTTAVWVRRNDGTNFTIQAATRPAGQASFGGIQNLSQAGEGALNPRIAVAADGTATAVWENNDGTGVVIQSATRPAGQPSFGATEDLSQAGANAFEAQVATSPDGATTVIWRRFDGATYIPQATTRPAGGSSFGPVQDLASAGEDASNPSLAVAPDGGVTAVWLDVSGGLDLVRAVGRPAGASSYSAPQSISASGGNSVAPKVAVAPNGAATAVWSRDNGSELIAQAASTLPTLHPLAVRAEGAGRVTSSPGGIECGLTCIASFTLSDTVTLTATPDLGAAFTGWTGDCSGSEATCTIKVLGARSVTATFFRATPSVEVRAVRAKLTRKGVLITSRVSVSGAGTIAQRATSPMGKKTKTWCKASKTVSSAGTLTLKCNLGKKGRTALRKKALKLTLRTTFTPATAAAVTSERKLTIKRRR